MKSMKYIRLLLKLVVGIILFTLLQVLITRFVPVYITPLMIIRLYEQYSEDKPFRLHHKWVPLDSISPHLANAVIASEDNLFLTHNGFDFTQIKKAIEESKKGERNRGASTISQQTAKNVFLWPSRSWIRKGLEAYYTVLIEFVWGKRRIMEVYLNSIEMGDGIYGAQSVAQHHFNKQALKLSMSEAATIAATLPNPIRMNSAKPGNYVVRRRGEILDLMNKIGNQELK
ncbi:monofunctional biosynthetic peptidoglycan transglycosylase [Porphyromonadaceae bacterium]